MVDYFGAEKLRDVVQDKMEAEVSDYDLFFLIELAFQFNLSRIFKLSF